MDLSDNKHPIAGCETYLTGTQIGWENFQVELTLGVGGGGNGRGELSHEKIPHAGLQIYLRVAVMTCVILGPDFQKIRKKG